MEENLQQLEAENTQQEQVEPEETTEQVEQTESTEPEKATEETQQAKNWRQMRELKDRAERERDEALQLLKQKYAPEPQLSTPPITKQDDFDIGDDDLVEGKHIKQYFQKLKTELDQYKQQTVAVSTEAQLKAQYPDFDKVVSTDNIQVLKELYPEVATTLHANPDLYSKAVSAYTLIKQFGIDRADQFEPDKQRAAANLSKPKPANAISAQANSALDNANAFAQGLTPDMKKQLWKEMQDAIKRR